MLIDLIPWVLALLPALWELKKVGRRHGWFLGIYAAVIVFGGIYLWILVLQSYLNQIPGPFTTLGVVATLSMLIGPTIGAVFIGRRTGLAAGVFAGVVVGICIGLLVAVISLSIYGT
ncbi:hypothetical protein [Hoeflea sp.]|uniref:hypothetical protein n=1 Tax=Hoeflea sp. TaxID=1940281 RepID=UPI003A8E9769